MEQLQITGDGVENPLTFDRPQLQKMEQYQHVYSTINTWPTKKWCVGKGVKLRALLTLAGIKEDAALINFISSDGYTVTLTARELLNDKRYYFPGLKENDASDGSISGSETDAQEVEPILALLSVEDSDNAVAMNDMNALMLMLGQRAVSEQTNNMFLKYINKVEVTTNAPPKWDSPKASVPSGIVALGTTVELSNKRNDADKIYYTTDGSTPTINSQVYNWSAKRWWGQRPDGINSINKPIEIKESTVIKAVTIGPGKEDSEVVTFSYQIGDPDSHVPAGVPSVGITLDQNVVKLQVGGSVELTATVGSNCFTDQTIIWSSSDTWVATVDNYGLVTLIGPGEATITAQTTDGSFTASCTVIGTLKAAEDYSSSGARSAQLNIQNQPEKPIEDKDNQQVKDDASNDLPDNTAQETPEQTEQPNDAMQYLMEKNVNKSESPGQISIELSDRQVQTWDVFEMSEEDMPLQMQGGQKEIDNLLILIFAILFFSGAGIKYRDYIKEVAK